LNFVFKFNFKLPFMAFTVATRIRFLGLSGLLRVAAGLALTAGIACAMHQLPVATPADAARGSERYPGLTESELQNGRVLLSHHCGSCHQTPSPMSRPSDTWPANVHEMKQRAHLDDEQASLIERYLVTMSMAAPHG
jgi:hypothetical protein